MLRLWKARKTSLMFTPSTTTSSKRCTVNGNTAPAALLASTSSAITESGIDSNNMSFNLQASEEEPPKSTEIQERRTEYGWWSITVLMTSWLQAVYSRRAWTHLVMISSLCYTILVSVLGSTQPLSYHLSITMLGIHVFLETALLSCNQISVQI